MFSENWKKNSGKRLGSGRRVKIWKCVVKFVVEGCIGQGYVSSGLRQFNWFEVYDQVVLTSNSIGSEDQGVQVKKNYQTGRKPTEQLKYNKARCLCEHIFRLNLSQTQVMKVVDFYQQWSMAAMHCPNQFGDWICGNLHLKQVISGKQYSYCENVIFSTFNSRSKAYRSCFPAYASYFSSDPSLFWPGRKHM